MQTVFLWGLVLLQAKVGADYGGWKAFRPGGQTNCSHGGEYAYMARNGSINNMIVEFAGGGCCYSELTCFAPTYTRNVDVKETLNKLKNRGGIGNSSDERNPVREWNHLFIPYCTGDAHLGSKTPHYGVHHVGTYNVIAALGWAKKYVTNPKKVFVTGGSAGSVGSYVWAPRIFDMFPDAEHYQMGDSYAPLFGGDGYNGGLKNWDILNSYDRSINDLDSGKWHPYISAYNLNATLNSYGRSMFASYISDGDPVQTGFYVFEGCGAEDCDWKKAMRTALRHVHEGVQASNSNNFASYISPSDIHVITESNEMYHVMSENISFSDWLHDLLYGGGNITRRVDCFQRGC